jgi:nucleoside-diphosphate-sugar epimerase
MKILVIGGTGLISNSISRELLEKGEELTLYNRGKSEMRFPPGAKTILGDRKDFTRFEAQMREAGTFDVVIDMVCFHPDEAESVVRAFKGRVGQVIFCSTVDVYSKPPDVFPITENQDRSGALGEYGQNKVKCEDVFFRAHEQGDFPATIIRPAYTYGEGGVIIHTFGWTTAYIDRLRKGKPVVVHGDGQSLWVCCHIDDVGHTFVAACGSPATFGRAYHTTGEEWLTWDQYNLQVAEAIGAPRPELVHIPSDLLVRAAPERAGVVGINFQFDNIFDNGAAKQDLDFQYTVPWKEGVRRTVGWLDERGKIQNSDEDPYDDRVIAAWRKYSEEMVTALKGGL